LFAVAIARALGAKTIIGIEPVATHAAMARKLGADVVLEPGAKSGNDYAHDPALVSEVRRLTDGVGADVVLEMSGLNSSVNNAIHCARRGGDVILFGLKSGDAIIESFDRLIVDGIALHSVIGRRIWETWHITRHLLESRDPNIHDLIYDVILNRGDGPIVEFEKFEKEGFEERIKTFPKVVLKF
jgi:threonine 3-dehydrogenase